jgi:hypothetical protein
MTLRADGWVDHVEMTRVGRQGNGVRLSLDFESSMAHVFMMRGAEIDTLHVFGATQPQPFLAVSLALSEQLVRAARLAPGQHVTFTAVRLGAADTVPLVLTRFHADSVSLVLPDVALRLALSRDGEVVGGTHSLQPWVIERRPAADRRGGGPPPSGLP